MHRSVVELRRFNCDHEDVYSSRSTRHWILRANDPDVESQTGRRQSTMVNTRKTANRPNNNGYGKPRFVQHSQTGNG
ncbi:unnamed protein product [Macrosiphum euphorbiae]|uniref:Uncharacterized protein n=1 Tax=Macrosiphum euphorbiae TaxID=13131 RepID=A0AAV0WBA3_9HEMI|nr:unnamed protein product [Macrosiphum euphorbiae]